VYEKIYKRKRNKKESENEKRGNEIEEKKCKYKKNVRKEERKI